MNAKIENIIFDLGGVILTIDYHRTIEAFKQLGIPDFDNLFTQFKQLTVFDQFERGEIPKATFLNKLKEYAGDHVGDHALIDAWNAMLGYIPQTNIDFLNHLQQEYRLFLLSNTNDLHYEAFFDYVEQWLGRRDLSPFFEAEYYSHQIGKRKPEPEVFQQIMHEHNLSAEATLFIDDSPQHLEGAAQLNLQTFYKTNDKNWKHLIEEFDLNMQPNAYEKPDSHA